MRLPAQKAMRCQAGASCLAPELFILQNPLSASLPVRVRTQTDRQAPCCRGFCKSLYGIEIASMRQYGSEHSHIWTLLRASVNDSGDENGPRGERDHSVPTKI